MNINIATAKHYHKSGNFHYQNFFDTGCPDENSNGKLFLASYIKTNG